MNYLAHFALSFPNEGLLVGNFIGDHIRNKDLPTFNKDIQVGVKMHRKIDYFTDTHHITKELRKLLFVRHRHLSRVLIDIIYDHFLAIHFSSFYQLSLKDFITQVQTLLQLNHGALPPSAQLYLKGMIAHDWLAKYQTVEGITYILAKMAKRSGIDEIEEGTSSLIEHYGKLQKGFLQFYPDVMHACTIFKNSIPHLDT